MAFNSKTYHINKQRKQAYAELDRARGEKASPFCDPNRVAFLVRFARHYMRCYLRDKGHHVSAYPINH